MTLHWHNVCSLITTCPLVFSHRHRRTEKEEDEELLKSSRKKESYQLIFDKSPSCMYTVNFRQQSCHIFSHLCTLFEILLVIIHLVLSHFILKLVQTICSEFLIIWMSSWTNVASNTITVHLISSIHLSGFMSSRVWSKLAELSIKIRQHLMVFATRRHLWFHFSLGVPALYCKYPKNDIDWMKNMGFLVLPI